MSKNIISRWHFYSALCFIALVLIHVIMTVLVYRKPSTALLSIAVYLPLTLLLKLNCFDTQKKEYLILVHTAVCLGIGLLEFLVFGIRRKPTLWFLFMEILYIGWLALSEAWLERQIAPTPTLVIGNSEHLKKWVLEHRNMYHQISKTDTADPDKIRQLVDLYRIPLVLTDELISDEVFQLVQEKGIAVHWLISGNPARPEEYITLPKYPEMYIYKPY